MHRFRRRPRTAQEKRNSQEGMCRAKRRPKNLIDYLDETWVKPQRSWKKHRRTQYKNRQAPPGGSPRSDTLRATCL